MKKRLFAMLSAMLLVLTLLAGCADAPGSSADNVSSGQSSRNQSTDESADASTLADKGEDAGSDAITLQVLNMPANKSGVMTGWFNDYLKEKLGDIDLEYLPTGDQGEQKLQALMASGELPDIIVFKDDKQVENAVAGDMLLAFDEYKELVPNLYNNVGTSMKYYADNLSKGQNKTYAVGVEINNAVETIGDKGSPYLRYDIYKQIGSPKINTFEDYLTVVKLMQEAEPVNADGKKVYGFSIWKDWDRSYMTLGMFTASDLCVTIPGEASLAEINHLNNDAISSILDDDSAYMRFLNFYFEANQLGLLDPDSMTQRFDDATQKAKDGRVLYQSGGWGTQFTREQEDQGIGFKRVPYEEAKVPISSPNLVGKGWSVSVGKASKYPEECMKVINFIYDYETSMVEVNGPKGSIWDIDDSGKPFVTEAGYAWYADPTGSIQDKGGELVHTYTSSSVNKDKNIPMHYTLWEKPDYAPEESVLTQTWKEDMQCDNMLEYHYKCGNVVLTDYVIKPLLTDEMEQISARVGDVIKTNSWKMVFAKDEAEFGALKEEMVTKAKGLGIDQYVEWFRDEYAKAKEFSAQYAE